MSEPNAFKTNVPPFYICEPTVYIGKNMLRINPATMCRIVQDWLRTYTDGGPYEVTNIDMDDDDFEVDFVAKEPTA